MTRDEGILKDNLRFLSSVMENVTCPITTIWQQCSQLLAQKDRLGATVFNMWFDPGTVKPIAIENDQLVLSFPPNSFVEWAENYHPQVEKALSEVMDRPMRVVFKVGSAPAAVPAKAKPIAPAPKVEAKPVKKAASTQQINLLNRLNRLYSFDSFVVGETNRFAFSACREVASAPGTTYNPLFIHGPSGMGKTHLMQAIAREVCRRNPCAVVEYLTSEQFGNLYVEACFNKGNNAMAEFRRRFRNVDVLLIDDVQFFAGKEGMQEEFFHTFNALYDEHKQIVCASDRMPQELPELSSRLVSRFEWGLTVDITIPDQDMRVAILERKQEIFERKIPQDILRYVASRIKSNVRNLESSLLTLHSYLSMPPVCDPEKLTRSMVDQIIGNKFEAEASAQLSISKIMECVAHHFDVRLQDIKGKSRLAEITLPRQVAMFLARKLTDKSLPSIADSFNKSHPTVLHSIDTIQSKMENSEALREQVATIERSLCYM